VSRLAGVLAIAIFGIVMLKTFDYQLAQHLAEVHLTSEIRNDLDSQRIKLAAIEVPEGIDVATKQSIRRSINESFLAGFRAVMWIASALALASALTSWSVIRSKS
jgi:hypothetical protein